MAELGEADEAELQRLVAAEQQKAQFTAQVRGQGPGGIDRRVRYKLSFQTFYSAGEVTAARKRRAELCDLTTGGLPCARSCRAGFFTNRLQPLGTSRARAPAGHTQRGERENVKQRRKVRARQGHRSPLGRRALWAWPS